MNEKHEGLNSIEKRELEPLYSYGVFDPRPAPEAQAANEAIFAKGKVYGIEVTIPALASRCEANLDPQHGSSGEALASAIEGAIEWELPPNEATLATVKPDIDSVGAMAVIEMRRREIPMNDDLSKRILLVADADRATSKPWPGKQELPNEENPWPSTFFTDPRTVAVLGASVSDFKSPLASRVVTMESYLTDGKLPEQYQKQVDDARKQLITALESGEMKAGLSMSSKVAIVVGKHRDAMTIGYSLAPIVVAFNPEFSPNPKVPAHAKYTVAQYKIGHANLVEALKELNQTDPAVTEEAKWGGSTGIIGSPQGISSQLTPEQVAEIVGKYIEAE